MLSDYKKNQLIQCRNEAKCYYIIQGHKVQNEGG